MAPPDVAANPTTPTNAPAAQAHVASRCGECHESYLSQWTGSAHAEAARSPVYQAMRARAPEPAACDRCHAPLAAALARPDPAAAEGVTCDVCHTIDDVALAPDAATWALQLAQNRKYGPLCDAKAPYFHRVGCSPLHATSRLCAACHHRAHVAAARDIPPVFGEFEEWQHHGAMGDALECQGCHMPDARGQVASGATAREGVSDHEFSPATSVALAPRVRREPDGLAVEVTLTSDGSVHALPVGLPGRQLVLTAAAVDADGHPLGQDEAVFARTLIDEHGAEVPFFAAVRQAADTRLQAGERRSVALRVPAAAASIQLTLSERLSPALARSLALPAPLPRVLESRWLDAAEAAR